MRHCISLFIFLLIVFGNINVFSQDHGEERLQEIFDSITSEEVMGYVDEMVDPRYKGRLAGSPEYMNVAQWAADLFRQWGIEPAGEQGTYFQYFEQPYSEVKSPGEFSIIINGQETRYFAPEDYYPGSNAANGRVEEELVFVGYGISAPGMDYDDYADVDVSDKIVVIAPGVPYKGQDGLIRTEWGGFSSGRYKLQNALSHGAAGAIYLDKLASPGAPYSEEFIYVHAGERPIKQIFESIGADYKDILETIDSSITPQSFNMGIMASLSAETVYHADGFTANLIGVIPGNDPVLKEEVVILGAHLDGQGYMGLHFPGALDNASGVANVMAAARALSQIKEELKRTVVFILFGAEETGLVGSEHYCLNPWAPIENTVVFLNLDMVGNGSGLAVWGVESFPELLEHFSWANDNYVSRGMRTSPFRVPTGRPRTDGAMFSLHGFRTLHIGTTDRVNPMFYHDPRDTPDLLVPDIMRDAARLLFIATTRIASDISFTTEDLPKVSEFE